MEQADKKRVPNRGSFAVGDPRINRNGRPRSGFALSERIRERLSPDELIDLVTKALADESIDLERRVAFAFQLAAHGYSKPPAGLDLSVTTAAPADYSHLSAMPLAERRDLLRRLRGEAAGDRPADESAQPSNTTTEPTTT